MRAFDSRKSAYIISFLLLLHAFGLGLCIYFAYHFIFLLKDSSGMLLIAFVVVMIVAMDVILFRCGLYEKLFLRIKMTECGIICYGFFIQKYDIPWASIRKYGISTKYFTEPLIFISMTQNEQKKFKELFVDINKNRVVFQFSDEIWSEMSKFMPKDMWYRINEAIQSGSDRVWKR